MCVRLAMVALVASALRLFGLVRLCARDGAQHGRILNAGRLGSAAALLPRARTSAVAAVARGGNVVNMGAV